MEIYENLQSTKKNFQNHLFVHMDVVGDSVIHMKNRNLQKCPHNTGNRQKLKMP